MTRLFVLAIAAAGCAELIGVEDVVLRPGSGGATSSSATGIGGADLCQDGEQNGNESDTDCGGGQCPPCQPGDHCNEPADCESGVCTGEVCSEPACNDVVKNGDETDIDCGGPCPDCGLGRDCETDDDCVSQQCDRNVCVPDPIGVWEDTGILFPVAQAFGVFFDPAQNRVVAIGPDANPSQMFEWDGSDWLPLGVMSTPSARYETATAVDRAGGRFFVVGGATSSGVLNDLQIWNGTAWTAAGGPQPSVRHGLAFDSQRGRLVFFGGGPSSGPTQWRDDTWEWDGSEWEQVASSGPLARGASPLAYDEARGVTVMVQGWTLNDMPEDSTWEWNGSVWVEHAVPGPPPQRFDHAMMYDPDRARTVLVSGLLNGMNGAKDTWEWDGESWVETVAPPDGPDDTNGEMAYDSVRKRAVYVFGANSPQTWEYYTLATACQSDSDCGSGECAEQLCCASVCDAPCEQCNSDGSPGNCTAVIDAEDPGACDGNMHCDSAGSCVPD